MRTAALLALFSLAACTASSASNPTAEANVSGAEKELTLDNVWLGHADPRSWEPGDPETIFPVAAQNYYGYSEFDGYTIDVSENCASHLVVLEGDGDARDRTYEIACSPGGDPKAEYVFARSVLNLGSEVDSDPNIIHGSSLKFEEGVTLKKVGPKHYLLDIVTK